MLLTQENYHSPEANAEYISASQIKTAIDCESRWWAEINGLYKREIEAFREGHYFETMLTGTEDEKALFQSQNPGMFSSTGATKGQLKANYKKVENAIAAIQRQDLFNRIILNSEKQVIMVGEIAGAKVKMMCDLMMNKSKSIYDFKAMANFKNIFSEKHGVYQSWWKAYNYDIQMAVYSEISIQNGNFTDNSAYGLIAATKAENADVVALKFLQETMDAARQDMIYTIGRMLDIKAGDEPDSCGVCPWCLSQKKITEFTEV